jgi:NifU-like domain
MKYTSYIYTFSLIVRWMTIVSSFTVRRPYLRTLPILSVQPVRMVSTSSNTENQIVSPFDHSADETESAAVAKITNLPDILDLTWENVELVLESMRHFLIQDGGNVVISDIDGPIVKLELQGNCGSCPSSTQTMKMGYVGTKTFLFEMSCIILVVLLEI